MDFYDFNTATSTSYSPVPDGTIAKLVLRIKPGGYSDKSKGWSNGYATKSNSTDSIYLNCEFTVVEGKYKGRKLWSFIGLYSAKNDNQWGDIGRSFIRNLLNSSNGFADNDKSEEATNARQIKSFADLDGLEFIAKVGIKEDEYGKKNFIERIITPDDEAYNKVMGKLFVDDRGCDDE